MEASRIIALDTRYGKRNPDLEKIQQAQDKYSFKAGEDKGYAHARQHCEDVIIPQAEVGARREVVEHIQECERRNPAFYSHIQVEKTYWQAKLKDWGVK